MRPAFKFFAAVFALFVTQIALAGPLITVYKTPTCGGCVKWVEYLQNEGFEVKAVNRNDLAPIKQRAGVPLATPSLQLSPARGERVLKHLAS